MAELIKTLTITVNTDKGTISIGKLEEKFKDTTKAAQALEKQINKNTGTFGRTENVIKKEIQLRTQLRAATAGGNAEYQRQSLAIAELEGELRDLTIAQQSAANSANKMRDKTGLAGAAAVELGRTISDSNYGFTAMANNISQLSTLMITLVATSGGVKGGFIELLKVMRGPIGFIVLFQVVITLFEKVAMKSKEAKESVDSLKNSFGESAAEVAAYTSILQDSNLPLEEKNKIVKELNKSHKDLNVELNEEGKLTEDSTDKIEKYIDILQKKARVEFYVTKLKENFNKIQAIENQELGDNLSLLEKAFYIYKDRSFLGASAEKTTKELTKINEEIDKFNKKIKEEGIFVTEGDDDPEKSYIASRVRVFKEKIFELFREEERFRQLGEKAEIKGQQTLIRIKADAAIDAIEIKKNEFIKDEKIRLDNFNKQSKEDEEREVKKAEKAGASVQAVRNRYAKQREDAEKISNQSLLNAEKEFKDAELVISESYFKQLDAFRKEDERKAKIRRDLMLMDESEAILAFNESMANTELGGIMIQEELEQKRHENQIKRINLEIEERKRQQKSFLDLEEKKRIEEDRNQREKTKLTKASEDARLGIINFAADAAIAIAGKGSALGKSIAVAMAIINTRKAITEALGDKEVPSFFRILHATAIGAFGFKQVKDIMATKLPVGDKGGAGGAASVSVAAPDFNVVGQGAGSQLAGVVGARFGEPIKAYVLSADVTSAQEMDRKIDSTATIG